MIDKGKYALLWANGMTFAEVLDLMQAEIVAELERLEEEER
jgi:hypothetical protein